MGVVGAGFVPEMDESEFQIDIETPPGSNLEYTRLKAQEIARIARQRPEVAYTYTTVGGQGDAVDEGIVFVKLVPKTERSRSQAMVVAEMRSAIKELCGCQRVDQHGLQPGRKADSAAGPRNRREGAHTAGTGGRG